jgi:hypothetical protein
VTRSDAELMRDAARASAEIGEDPAALLEAARLISGKLSDADTAMVTLRTVWKRAEPRTSTTSRTTDWESATDDEVSTAAQRIYNMMAISATSRRPRLGSAEGSASTSSRTPTATSTPSARLTTLRRALTDPTARCLGRARRSKIGSSYGSPRRASRSFERLS